ncbi:SET domain-containing protein SmydA-8-like 4 [Homarus americanus]|uniref:SET domain-containing protein SmydA-8-like 4 n=1 Tax=Homarus americanus TaxID=6706 RepID=A0A8J5N901_HOMAM|nr:SET domain-containing protein SmydA-8-like 4 [Homarus americanus]
MPDSQGVCEVCSKAAKQFCSSCRHMVATRDIRPGEVILKEAPVVIGPKQRSPPVCLGCHKGIRGTYTCPKCHFPVCAPSCEISKYHKHECPILTGATAKIKIDNVESPHPAYECITPLRCLLTKETDPKKWEAITHLQDHVNNIKNGEMDGIIQRNSVDFLKNYIKYEGADSAEIYRMCGILLTNSFELKHNGQRVRGLYPQAAMMAHDCIPNTKHAFDEDLMLVLRATVVIRKGTPITSTYTNILWNTLQRRKQLKVAKHFLCSCRRCSDPTELGTHLSTLLCSECGGHVQSTAPLDMDANWACQKCSNTVLGKTVFWGDQILYKELRGLDQVSVQPLEKFLETYKKALHPKHRFFVEAKYALIKFYGNHPEYRYRDITRQKLEKKVEYCRELLELAGTIDPGLSLFRGTLLFELQAALVALARMLLSNDVITKEGTQDYMTEAVKHLQEASEILKHEPEMEKGGLDAKLKTLSEELDI